MMTPLLTALLTTALSTTPTPALTTQPPLPTTTNLPAARLTFPHVSADRRDQTVRIAAQATGISSNDIIEFILIGESSGHDYEAVATTAAKPGDIHQALEFIGIPAGRPFDPGALQFWPKGERVRVTVLVNDGSHRNLPIPRLLVDRSGSNGLDHGFVFAGSHRTAQQQYAADIEEPQSILSLYNEPNTVLDLPHQARQSQVYGRYFVHPDARLTNGCPLEIQISPLATHSWVRNVTLHFEPIGATESQSLPLPLRLSAPDGVGRVRPADRREQAEQDRERDAAPLPPLNFTLLGSEGPLCTSSNFNDVVGFLRSLNGNSADIYLNPEPGPATPLAAIRAVYAVLAALEDQALIRIEPPTTGHLFLRAFLPDPAYRDRTQRMGQPWELRLFSDPLTTTGILTQVTETWSDDELAPAIMTTDYPIDSPDGLKATLATNGPGLPVILVTAPDRMLHHVLLRFLAPILPQYNTIYVFLNTDAPPPQDP